MCFTPQASLITAIIELGVTVYLIKKIKTKRLLILPLFVFILAIYQFSEFMLCSQNGSFFWARTGFQIYTLIPAVILHMFYNLVKKKISKLIYIVPAIFIALSFSQGFTSSVVCNTIHVSIQNLVFGNNFVLMYLYLAYYSLFPFLGIYQFIKKIDKNYKKDLKLKLGLSFAPLAILFAQIYFLILALMNNLTDSKWIIISSLIIMLGSIAILYGSLCFSKEQDTYYKVLILTTLSSPLIALLLYWVLPIIRFDLSSIFCQFALFYAIAIILIFKTINENK